MSTQPDRDPPVSTGPALRRDLAQLPRYVPGKPSTPDGFKLSSNELPEPPTPHVVSAVAASATSLNRYPGIEALELGARLADSLGVDAPRIVSGAGSIAVLQQLIQAVVEPGQRVVFAWRSYEAYPILANVCHAEPITVPLVEQRHDLIAMADAVIETDAAMVIVCNPNNPTGTWINATEIREFLERVPTTCTVVLDEAYWEFVTDKSAPDGVDLATDRENVVVLRTFSKAYALAGARVGYAYCPERIADAIRAVALPFTVSSVAQAAALAALESWPDQRLVVDELIRRRDRFVGQLRKIDVTVPESQANFVWIPWAEMPPNLGATLAEADVTVRIFADDGARITVGEATGLRRVLGTLVEEREPR